MTLLQIRSLTKSFAAEKPAVDGVSFTVAEGEIICLLGPSGCGKTTLLRMIAGLEKPDSGEVRLRNRSITSVAPHQRDFGMMFQDFALFPHKNVFDNIAFGLQMRGDRAAQVQAQVTQMLDLVDLRGFENRDISQLSGGEQQRVALARSLAPDPQILMLDEPLGALDRALRERLMHDLRSILKQVGVTAIYVTHDQTEAFAIADRVVVMNQGRIEQMDRPQIIFTRPATPFVARFLGFHNLLTGRIETEGGVATTIGLLPLPVPAKSPGEAVVILLKPEAAFPAQVSRPVTANIYLPAVITAISFRGRYYQVWVAASRPASLKANCLAEDSGGDTPRSGERLMFELPSVSGWEVGAEIELWLDTAEILVW